MASSRRFPRCDVFAGRTVGGVRSGAPDGTPALLRPAVPDDRRDVSSSRKTTGIHPAWSPDGQELFYHPSSGQLVAVSVTTRADLCVRHSGAECRDWVVDRGPGLERNNDIMPTASDSSALSLPDKPDPARRRLRRFRSSSTGSRS